MFSKYVNVFFIIMSSIVPLVINPRSIYSYYEPKVNVIYISCLLLLLLYMVALRKKEVPKLALSMSAHKFMLIYGALVLLSTLFSVNIGTAVFGLPFRDEGAITIFCYIVIFMFASNFYEFKKEHVRIFAISCFIISVYGILQYYNINPIYIERYKLLKAPITPRSTLGNENYLGTYLTLTLPIMIFAYIYSSRIIYLVTSSTAFFALMCTFTRSAWIAFPFYMSIMLFYIIKLSLNWKRYLVIVILFTIALSCFTFTSGNFTERLSSIRSDAGEAMKNASDNVGSGRMFIWKRSITLIAERPILGSGPDTFGEVFMNKYRNESKKYFENWYVDKAHNEFLQIGVTIGIPALITYIIFLVSILFTALRKTKSEYWVVAVLCSFVGYNIQAIFNISIVGNAPIYFMFLGIMLRKNNFNLSIVSEKI